METVWPLLLRLSVPPPTPSNYTPRHLLTRKIQRSGHKKASCKKTNRDRRKSRKGELPPNGDRVSDLQEKRFWTVGDVNVRKMIVPYAWKCYTSCSNVFCTSTKKDEKNGHRALFLRAPNWKQTKCPSCDERTNTRCPFTHRVTTRATRLIPTGRTTHRSARSRTPFVWNFTAAQLMYGDNRHHNSGGSGESGFWQWYEGTFWGDRKVLISWFGWWLAGIYIYQYSLKYLPSIARNCILIKKGLRETAHKGWRGSTCPLATHGRVLTPHGQPQRNTMPCGDSWIC